MNDWPFSANVMSEWLNDWMNECKSWSHHCENNFNVSYKIIKKCNDILIFFFSFFKFYFFLLKHDFQLVLGEFQKFLSNMCKKSNENFKEFTTFLWLLRVCGHINLFMLAKKYINKKKKLFFKLSLNIL